MSNVVVYFENCLRLRIAGQILRLPSDCICAALTLYHRYRRVHSGDTHEQRMLAACLFCASKLEEAECRTTDLLNVIDAVFHPSPDVVAICPTLWRHHTARRTDVTVKTGEAYYAEKEVLISAEHLLLRTIDFDITLPHPQRELLSLCRDIAASTAVTTVAARLMNDTIAYTDFVLTYEPGAIAASVLHVSLALLETAPTEGPERKWYEELGFDVEVVETLGHRLIDMLTEIATRARN